ncbi:thiopurine S-methyltransferase-like isoform X2 [Amblyomma americanum]
MYLHKIENHFMNVGKQLRVFFPFCGKMKEMKWFYDHGHQVVGVEIAEKPVRDFFHENNLPVVESHCSATESKNFQSLDGRLIVYCTDIFAFLSSQPPPMDVVWDRASLCIMASQKERLRYVELMKSVLAPGYMYILTTFRHDNSSFTGPPHNVADSDVMELFGDIATLTKVCELVNGVTVTGIPSLYEVTWCIRG